MRVLVVDDNAMNRVVVKHLCRHLGLEFLEAASGPAALALLQNTRVDVLLLDLGMPGMSGEETLAQLRSTAQACQPPAVAYSAHTQGDDARRLLDQGFRSLLGKPITIDSFRRSLADCGLDTAGAV